MTKAEALEIALSAMYVAECTSCEYSGFVNVHTTPQDTFNTYYSEECRDCHGHGYFITREYLQACELLGVQIAKDCAECLDSGVLVDDQRRSS